MIFRTFLILMLIVYLPITVFGQTETGSAEGQDTENGSGQETQLERLERLVRELQARIEEAEREDEMKELVEEARRLAARERDEGVPAEERKFYSGLRQHSALNPNISVGGDYYYAYGTSESDYNREVSNINWGTGRFFLREMEISFESVLDPYARGKAFIGIGEEGADVCEAYMQLLNWPLNMNLKLGKYRMQFGSINRWHCHALPQFDRPLVMANFFGNESLKGVGAAANFLLPSLTAHVNELDLEIASAGDDLSFTSEGKHHLVYVAHLKNYWDINRGTYVEVGLSGALGNNDPAEKHRTQVGGMDLKVKWTPPGKAKYRGIEWWTEILYSSRETEGENIESWGLFSLLQYRLGSRLIFGCRFDYSELPYDNCLKEYGGTANLDYWQSEFVVFRLQYSHIDRNFDEDDDRIIVQTVWAMGPHKHEAY